jgi:hypothetical protein
LSISVIENPHEGDAMHADYQYVVYCYDRNQTLARDPYWSDEKAPEIGWFGRTFVLCEECPGAILVYKEV